MSNTAKKTETKLIESVVCDIYGVNALNCDAITIEWAAGRLEESHGAQVAAKEWQRVNARRYRLGLYTTIPQWGTAIYAAYFS